MFKNNRIIKKIGAGFMAGLCAFSMLGTSMGGVMSAKAEYIAGTENPAFPTVDEVIFQAATLLGSPYAFGCKGFTGIYYQDSYKPLDTEFVRNQGIDCSGLVYYTLTHLGFKTAGFSWNNPVPVDSAHWLSVNSDCTITYGDVTTKVDVEKMSLPTPADSDAAVTYEYWECEDGSTITPGSVVVANKTGTDHCWIYMGEFDSRDEVVSYLKNIGVPETLITAQTVGSGNGGGGKHWRIESNGSQGVVINNNVDGKSSSAFECSAFRITQREVTFEIKKVYKEDNTIAINGTSPIDGTKAIYGVYTEKECTNKVAEITIGEDGTGSIELPNAQYYVKEISAPTGYDLSTEVFALNANKQVFVTEEVTEGVIKINKTAEDGIVADREFKVSWNEAGVERYRTAVTNSNGIAEFSGLPVYDFSTKKAITYTISEINVEITAENEAITVEISKQDIYGSELAGAEMQLVDENGEVIDEWVSDGTNHVISELKVGKYTLKETAAPDGYVIATDISFEVFEDGSAIVENVDAAATTEDGHPLIVMVDNTTKVEISKRDITTDNELAGATLQIIDDKCNVVEEWVSADKPHYIEAKLIAGKTYTLTETAAPNGYTIANSIDFTVNADGTITPVVMYDEPVPDTPDIPTGDTTSRLPGILMIAAGLVMVLIAGIGRKKKDESDDYAALCPDFIETEEE